MAKLSTFQIALLVIFGALGISGILIFALVSAGANNSSVGNVVIWGTFPESAIRPILRDAIDTNSSLSGVTYVQLDPATYESNLTSALASGTGPDLFFMRQDRALVDGSFSIHIPFTSLTQAQFQGTFLDAASPFIATDGTIAVPLFSDPLVIFWNKDALASAGYSAAPQYWDQVPSMVEKLVTKSDAGTITKAGIALGEFDNISSAKDIVATMIQQAGGQITAYDSAGVLHSGLGAQGSAGIALAALDYYTEFANPAQPDYSWSKAFPDAASAFAAGDVAMYVGHASESASIQRANPNLNFTMSALPQIRAGARAFDSADVYGLALSHTSKNAKGALTVAYVIAAPAIAKPLADAIGLGSALKSQLGSSAATPATAANPLSNAINSLVSATPLSGTSLLNYEASISHSWFDPNPEKTNELFRAMIEDTVSGAQTAPAAVQRADKQLIEILGG